jgi:hypothetical protein
MSFRQTARGQSGGVRRNLLQQAYHAKKIFRSAQEVVSPRTSFEMTIFYKI